MSFIDGDLPENKQEDFLIHMKSCDKCHNELEIYYTLMVGMRQLDNNENLSMDFSKDLEKDLKLMSHKIRNRRGFKMSAFSVVLIITLIVIAFIYAGSLSRIYGFEQRTKLSNQGEYYFSESLSDNMVLENADAIYKGKEIDKAKEITDFDRIKGYNRLERDHDRIKNIGEEIIHDGSDDE